MKEKQFKYVNTIFSSLPEPFKEPLLLVPFLFGAILAIIYTIISANITTKLNSPVPNMSLVAISILILIVYIIIQMLVGSMALASFRMFIDGKKLSLNKQFNGGLLLFWKYVGLSFLKGIMIAVPVVMLSFTIILITFLFSANESFSTGNIILLTLVGIVIVILILLLGLMLMFSDVILTEKKNVFEAIKESYKVFRNHFGHSFKTMLSLILFMFVYIGILSLVLGAIFGFESLSSQNQTGTELSGILMNLLGIPASATALLYIFKSRKQSLVLMKKKK